MRKHILILHDSFCMRINSTCKQKDAVHAVILLPQVHTGCIVLTSSNCCCFLVIKCSTCLEDSRGLVNVRDDISVKSSGNLAHIFLPDTWTCADCRSRSEDGVFCQRNASVVRLMAASLYKQLIRGESSISLIHLSNPLNYHGVKCGTALPLPYETQRRQKWRCSSLSYCARRTWWMTGSVILKTLYLNWNGSCGWRCAQGMQTEEKRAWLVCPGPRAWRSTRAEQKGAEEFEAARGVPAGVGWSGNRQKKWDEQKVITKWWTRRKMVTHLLVI